MGWCPFMRAWDELEAAARRAREQRMAEQEATLDEIAAQGMGAKYVLDGTDTCAAMFNPEGDAGDVEMWELICPMIYLSRRIKANSGGVGRPRGGSSFESLQMIHGNHFWALQDIGPARLGGSPEIVGGDADNLVSLIQDESTRREGTYRRFAEQARAAGELEVAECFDQIRADERDDVNALERAVEHLAVPA